MKLKMQFYEGTPEDLSSHENEMSTGTMGGCVSIIILYNFDATTQTYKSVRGWHGWGGIEFIDMDKMLLGVPITKDTQVHVIYSPPQNTLSNMQQYMQGDGLLNKLSPTAIAWLKFVSISFHCSTDATVRRDGTIIETSSITKKKSNTDCCTIM